jgi:integrase
VRHGYIVRLVVVAVNITFCYLSISFDLSDGEDPEMPTYENALVSYLTWRTTRGAASVNTVRGERPGLRAFGTFIGNPEVGEITAESVGLWWDALTLADSTKGTRLTQLRSFLRYCLDQGWIGGDPTSLIRAPKVRPEPRDRLTPDELLALLDLARTPRDRCLMALAMNLGLRGGEIGRLRWRDVAWGDLSIRVFVDKTNEVDDMPLTEDLLNELTRWAPYAIVGGSKRDGQYLIPAQHVGAQGVTYKWGQPVKEPYAVVKRALADAGWEDVRYEGVHTIRRSVARIYFDKVEAEESFDSALLATMTLLHHTRPETTLRYIGRDRASLARDRILKGKPFLSALRTPTSLRAVS